MAFPDERFDDAHLVHIEQRDRRKDVPGVCSVGRIHTGNKVNRRGNSVHADHVPGQLGLQPCRLVGV